MSSSESNQAPSASRSTHTGLVIVKVVAVAILATVLWSLFQTHDGGGREEMPPFELAWLEGGVFTNADLEGRITVINFFATWCGPCKMEMPGLNRFAASVDPAKVRVVGVSAGDEDRVSVREFAFVQRMTFPVAVGGEVLLGTLSMPKLPTTVIVDSKGKVVDIYSGVVTEERLTRRIAELTGS